MLPPVNGHTESYLDDLDRIQSALNTVQRQVSSGVRVGVASDDPAAVPTILQTQSGIAMDQQVQTNLNLVKTDLESGDTALQQAAKLMDQAVSLATQAGNPAADPTRYDALLQQALAIQQSMVGITATVSNGRYIFSGDRPAEPLYALDATQPNGVRQLAPAASTVSITDRSGNEVWRPRTAAEIFDAGDATNGNVFAAVAGLVAALRNRDTQASQTAVINLKAASDHLSQQLGIYGIGENRVADALTASSQAVVSEKETLSTARDTDLAAAAVELSQTQLQQQSALSVGARIAQQKSLFDYLA